MTTSRARGTATVAVLVGLVALTGCTGTGGGGGDDAPPAAAATTGGDASDASTAAFPEADTSASFTCGQVSAYVSVIFGASTDRDAGALDDDGYRARVDGAGELLGYLGSDDPKIATALSQLTALSRDGETLDPTTESWEAARGAVADACEAAGSPLVLSAPRSAGG